MKRLLALLLLLVALAPLSAPAAFTISLSPGSIGWDSNTWVNVRITNNTTKGYAANLTIFIDPDRNGIVGTRDVPLFNLMLRDGQTNRFGAATIPDDDDGTTNGAILTRISCFGVDSPLHTIGSYIARVAFTNGTSSTTTVFTVTQPTTTLYITGRVVNYTNPAAPVAAALVEIHPFTSVSGFLPDTWTDTNGDFRVYLPPGMTGNVAGIAANAFGYFSVPVREDTGEWISGYRFESDLHIGGNALTNTLKVIPSVPGMVHTATGRVIDDAGNRVPFALVMFEEESDDSDAMGIAMTDSNGNFRLPVPDGLTGWFGVEGGLLNPRGLVASGAGPYTLTQDVSGIEIECPAATILAASRAVDVADGSGVAGVCVDFESDGFWSSTYSVSGGLYEVCLVSNTYKAGTDSESVEPMGYVPVMGYDNLAITDPGLFTNAPIPLARGYTLSGTVYDRGGNPLTDGEVRIAPFEGWDGNDCDANRHGYYVGLAATGTYRVTARDFNGYLEQVYSNRFTWEWDNGPAGDPVTVIPGGTAGIDFFLWPASYIRGTVYATNAPLAGATVGVSIGDTGLGGRQTEDDGTYELAVLAGTNYMVQAQGPDGSFFIPQYWSNKTEDSEADLVTTDTNAPAENIDFNLPLGGRIEGTLYDADGATPLTQTWGFVEAQTTNEESSFVAGQRIDEDDGTYGFPLAAGIYHVFAEAQDRLEQYYEGLYEYQSIQANAVTVQAGQVTGGIDFTMQEPSYIEGTIRSGGSPVEGVQVSVEYVADTNTWHRNGIGDAESDGSGFYSVPVPPASNLLVVTEPGGDSFYIAEIWSNALTEQAATLVAVSTAATLSDIDFDLDLGMRITGRVVDENDSPLQDLAMAALIQNSNGFHDVSAWGYTDSDGYYAITVPATTSYIVRANRPWYVSPDDWWYPKLFYSNTLGFFLAAKLSAAPSSSVDGIDFRLEPGYRINGDVYRSDGTTPAPDPYVSVFNASAVYLFGEPREGGGYLITVLTNEPFRLQASASDCMPEYHDNVYNFAAAAAVQGSVMTTVRVDFVLYGTNEDTDADGLWNHQEDTRPDGSYIPAEDWCSYTNRDTDADHIDDRDETNWDLDPELADTDNDSFTDWQEIYVTGTDATASPSGSNSYLHCLRTTRDGPDVIVNWSAIAYVGNYYIQRSTNLTSGASWIDRFGPLSGTGTVMTVVDSNAPPNSAYRVRIPYVAP